MALVIRGGLVLTLDDRGTTFPGGEVVIEDGLIRSVGPSAGAGPGPAAPSTGPPAPSAAQGRGPGGTRGARGPGARDDDELLDATGMLVMPGLINAHTHSPTNILRGSFDRLDHAAFMWRNQAETANRAPREIYLSALAGCGEMLRSGTTGLIDHFPEQTFGPADVDAVCQAYLDAGIRAAVALRVYDLQYADIFPAEPVDLPPLDANPLKLRPVDEVLDLCRAAIERWQGRGERLQIFLGPSAPLRCSDRLLRGLQDLAEHYRTGVHTHLLESRVQVEIARELFGTSQVAHLDELGLLSPRLSCAHCVWVDEPDAALLAARGVTVVHNPESNLKLGVGIAPIARMRRAGVHVALGTDGASTNDNLLMFESVRLAALLHRPFEPDPRRWISAGQALTMATAGGARALLQEGRLGTLQPGRAADVVLLRLDAPWFRPLRSPIEQLVFGETGASVDTVIVQGQVVVRGGRVLTFSEEEVWQELEAVLPSMAARNQPVHELAEAMIARLGAGPGRREGP
ncbi:MAG: amidohydrolase [Deltaproteobacteria bacterium]|nr:amidohydrolase [Deltaproteobacteria bacterium]MBI3078011.1 amidohydrolase [Deltaproteobacteria bacterium]